MYTICTYTVYGKKYNFLNETTSIFYKIDRGPIGLPPAATAPPLPSDTPLATPQELGLGTFRGAKNAADRVQPVTLPRSTLAPRNYSRLS